MKSLTDIQSALLEWRRRTAAPPAFDLHAPEGIVATLAFKDQEGFEARAETAEGSWTFKHTGLLAPMVTVREEGATENLAVFHPHALRHGVLRFGDGADFEWAWLHDAQPGGAFLDVESLPLVRVHAPHMPDAVPWEGPEQGQVELGLAPRARWRHALLAALGWYLVLWHHYKEITPKAAENALLI